MKKYINGEYIEMTEREIDAIKAENQRELLANASEYNLTQEDILMILASQVSITLPTGQTETADNLVNTTIDLPRKVGYKWVLEGTTFVSVPDSDYVGTQENPIIYTDDVPMLDNHWYKQDGILKVCMGGELLEM